MQLKNPHPPPSSPYGLALRDLHNSTLRGKKRPDFRKSPSKNIARVFLA